MFERITPEQAGIRSEDLVNLIETFNRLGLNTHGMLMMKGDKVFFETYYKPFNKDYIHRLYSETKSFVSIAIGLLEEEGKLYLDDPIIKYFPEYLPKKIHPYMEKQTIKDMLTMRTCCNHPMQWFYVEEDDRVKFYFDEKYSPVIRPSGMYWEYDSDGSQVLCALVEKLSGMKLLDYLKSKMFNDMGVFQNAFTLDTPTGVTWGDSAMLCTLRDQAAFGRLVMNYGIYNGKRYINEKYVKTATSRLVDNAENCFGGYATLGYGYQIWHLDGNNFAFTGMGDQLTFMYKDKDILFAIHSSNQGSTYSRQTIYEEVKKIIQNASDKELQNNEKAYKNLTILENNQEIRYLSRGEESFREKEISGVRYICEDNQMNIKEFTLTLEKDSGTFSYVNATGRKEIHFGRGKNIFEKFPQEGYSNMVGKVITKDYFYECANSGRWLDNEKFMIETQIIDKYFGNLTIYICFKEDKAFIRMTKNAENFLREYFGTLVATRE